MGAAQASGAFDGPAPVQRQLDQERTADFMSQYDLLDPRLGADMRWRPNYLATDLNLTNDALFGRRARTYTEQVPMTPQELLAEHNRRTGMNLQATPDTLANIMKIYPNGLTKAVKRQDYGAPGILDIYGRAIPQLTKLSAAANAGTAAAWRAADPAAAALMDEMTRQAGSDLAAGRSLTPMETRELNNTVRSGQAARGLGFGPADIYGEALARSQYGDQKQAQRRAFAGDVYGLRTRPLLQLLDNPSTSVFSQAGTALGTAGNVSAASGPRLIGLDTAGARDVFGGNTDSMNNYNATVAQNRQAGWGNIASGFGSLVGGGIKAYQSWKQGRGGAEDV